MDSAHDLLPFKNVLLLSDFSPCSDNALQCALAITRTHGAKLFVLHVVVPDTLTYMSGEPPAVALDLQEQWARDKMKQLEERLSDVPYQTFVVRDDNVWPSVALKVIEMRSDLLVLGTRGRTGFDKLFLGSVAETILRQSPIPVMSIGPEVPPSEGRFHRVLLATDLQRASAETARYAVALARRDRSSLTLLHTYRTGPRNKPNESAVLSVAEALHQLHDLAMPLGNENPESRSQSIIEFGDSKLKILEVARRTNADLIVIGIAAAKSVLVASHLEIGTAHAVIASARCPVLTVPDLATSGAHAEAETKTIYVN